MLLGKVLVHFLTAVF